MNLFANIPAALPVELSEVLAKGAQLRIERIVSHGHCSPPGFWYDQTEYEFVLLVQGAARLQFEDEHVELRPGDWLVIAPHRKHRVAWTAPDIDTIWLAVFHG